MQHSRPLHVLALVLASAAGNLSEASAVAPRPPYGFSASQPSSADSQHVPSLDDGYDLERIANRLAQGLAPDPATGHVPALDYESKIETAARFPTACKIQLDKVIHHIQAHIPMRDQYGTVADFANGNGKVKVFDKHVFEKQNWCIPGKNETTPESLGSAAAVISILQEILNPGSPPIKVDVEKSKSAITAQIVGDLLQTPGCGEPLQNSARQLSVMNNRADMSPETKKFYVSQLVKQLGEGPFTKGAACESAIK